MDPIQLGKFLSQLRNEKNLTQEELADKLFIDKRKVSRWECGTSIPDFDLLIQLSKILDVSLYELSICKRIKNENITNRILNKFKTIKDYKKYTWKRKIILIIKAIFILISLFAIFYTIKNQGSVEIYELKSDSDEYSVIGHLIKYNNQNIFNINKIIIKEDKKIIKKNDNCIIEIYNNRKRLIQKVSGSNNSINNALFNYTGNKQLNNNQKYTIVLDCNSNQNSNTKKEFNFYLDKKYSNSIF